MQRSLDLETAYQIGIEGYTYLYPLVIMDVTRRQLTNVEAVDPSTNRGPVNVFVNAETFPSATSREVVRPNFDTLYSSAWLDLQREPLVIEVPPANDRYYLLPMLDMWTEVFASPGTRTTGNGPQKIVVVGPGWNGTINDTPNLQRIDAPTPHVWIIGRTQCSGGADYDVVHRFQDRLKIIPYSMYAANLPPPPPVGSSGDPIGTDEPPVIVERMAPDEYFAYAAKLMFVNPAHFNDYPVLAQLKRAGFVPGQPFELNKAPPTVQEAFRSAVPVALERIKAKQLTLTPLKNGWTFANEGMGTYATDYLRRATVALFGLGANLAQDAIYPVAYVDSANVSLRSAERYTLRFAADSLPPVNAFWSVTMYDEEGYQVENRLNRFSLGTRNQLTPGEDQSVTLYVQRNMADGDPNVSNWLPAPQNKDLFNLTMRLYYPQQPALDGVWAPPPVIKQL